MRLNALIAELTKMADAGYGEFEEESVEFELALRHYAGEAK